jgi:2-iminobutanoate/2-iminopropanoate deaminase
MPIKKVISTTRGPQAIGPYSQAIRAGNLVFVSGQIALDPNTGKLIEDLSIEAQTRRVLQNVEGILSAAGLSASHVVKVTVYLSDMTTFQDMNAVYAEFFPETQPARAAVEVAALPLGVGIEVDCIAVVD